MSKSREPIPDDISSEVLFASDRTCCVCQVPGKPVQIHRIDSDPSNNAFENLAVLCLICHNDTELSGGFDRKLKPEVVIRYRRDWLARVQKRREEADRIILNATTNSKEHPRNTLPFRHAPSVPSRVGMKEFIQALPTMRRAAYEAAKPGWDSGVTMQMVDASYHVVQVLENAMLQLAAYYPAGHFDGENPRDYFSELITSRFRWHGYHQSTSGVGHSGTIVGPLAAGDVITDCEQMIEDLVWSLTINWGASSNSKFHSWRDDWRNPPGKVDR